MLVPIPSNTFYLILALGLTAGVITFVPKSQFKSLFARSLLFGSAIAFFVNLILGQWIGCFYYRLYEAFHIFKVPFWIVFAWSPAMMLFLYFLPERRCSWLFWGYILVFSGFSMSIDTLFHQLDLLKYTHWGPLPRFVLAFIWFYFTAKYGRPPVDTSGPR